MPRACCTAVDFSTYVFWPEGGRAGAMPDCPWLMPLSLGSRAAGPWRVKFPRQFLPAPLLPGQRRRGPPTSTKSEAETQGGDRTGRAQPAPRLSRVRRSGRLRPAHWIRRCRSGGAGDRMSFSANSALPRPRRAGRARRPLAALLASLRLLRWLFAIWAVLTLLLIGWLLAGSRPRVNASPNPPPATWSRSGHARSWERFL